MTEQTPINQNAAEQRLIEELTGSPTPPRPHGEDEPMNPGDPEAAPEEGPVDDD